MRPVLLIALLVVGCTANVQPLRTQPNRLLTTSADLNRQDPIADESVKNVREGGFLSSNLVVRYADGTTRHVPKRSVWGYADKKGKVWRRYRSSFYEVVQVGELVEYHDVTTQNYQANGNTVSRQEVVSLYSRTLDSPIYSTKRRALREPVGN